MIKKIDSLLFEFTAGKMLGIWTATLLLTVLATSMEISRGLYKFGGFTTWLDVWALFSWLLALHLFKKSMKKK